MEPNINTEKYWDQKHNKEFSTRYIPPVRRLYHDFVLEQIKDKGNIIDVGCGNGLFIEDALNRTKYIQLYGVDFSKVSVTKNRQHFAKFSKRMRHIVFAVADVCNMVEISSNYFNHVVCMEVLEHITDTNKLLKELNRICKPGGRIFIIIPNNKSIVSEEHVHYFTNQYMHDILSKYGRILDVGKFKKPGSRDVRNLGYVYEPFK